MRKVKVKCTKRQMARIDKIIKEIKELLKGVKT